jgi:mRNA-degrading endonuclease RelE of RelBE toxin-antitoxin system
MIYKVLYHPLFQDDIQQAIDWYNEQQDKLGNELYYIIRIQIEKITENPFSFSIKYNDTRTALISKFPYSIHYSVDEESKTIILKAIFHTSRNPKQWKKR